LSNSYSFENIVISNIHIVVRRKVRWFIGELVLMFACYRKRQRLDRDEESEDVSVKTEPFIPGLDLVDEETGSAAVKEEDVLNTGAPSPLPQILFCFF